MKAILCFTLLTVILQALHNSDYVDALMRCWDCNSHVGCVGGYGQVTECYYPKAELDDFHPSYLDDGRESCVKIIHDDPLSGTRRYCGRFFDSRHGLNLREGCRYVTPEEIQRLKDIMDMGRDIHPGQYCACFTGDECNAGVQPEEVTKPGAADDTPPVGHTLPSNTTIPTTTPTTTPTTMGYVMDNINDSHVEVEVVETKGSNTSAASLLVDAYLCVILTSFAAYAFT